MLGIGWDFSIHAWNRWKGTTLGFAAGIWETHSVNSLDPQFFKSDISTASQYSDKLTWAEKIHDFSIGHILSFMVPIWTDHYMSNCDGWKSGGFGFFMELVTAGAISKIYHLVQVGLLDRIETNGWTIFQKSGENKNAGSPKRSNSRVKKSPQTNCFISWVYYSATVALEFCEG